MNKIQQLHEFLKENPKDTFLRYALALEYVKVNELAMAKIAFEELILQDPDYLPTYYQYGNLLAEIGQLEPAEVIYKKGMEIATSQNKLKTRQELERAIFLLD